MVRPTDWRAVFQAADADHDQVVLEGVHALKHALRFGADVTIIVSAQPDALAALVADLAPDLIDRIRGSVQTVPGSDFRALSPRPPGSPVLAIASRPTRSVFQANTGRTVVLVNPRHAGNTGAVIRVAAASGAAAVITTGDLDPWNRSVVRAAAGLHYAIQVDHRSQDDILAAPYFAFDPDHGDTDFWSVPSNATVVFGGEREGLSMTILRGAERVLRIPMRAGVSSLNLATSVAVVVYSHSPTDPPVRHS